MRSKLWGNATTEISYGISELEGPCHPNVTAGKETGRSWGRFLTLWIVKGNVLTVSADTQPLVGHGNTAPLPKPTSPRHRGLPPKPQPGEKRATQDHLTSPEWDPPPPGPLNPRRDQPLAGAEQARDVPDPRHPPQFPRAHPGRRALLPAPGPGVGRTERGRGWTPRSKIFCSLIPNPAGANLEDEAALQIFCCRSSKPSRLPNV